MKLGGVCNVFKKRGERDIRRDFLSRESWAGRENFRYFFFFRFIAFSTILVL